MSQPRFRKIRHPFARPRVEALEDRVVPTVHLFIDFGDSFGASGLSITDAELTGSFAGGGIQGPVGLGVGSMKYTSLGDEIVGVLDYNHDGVLDTADYDDLKTDIISLVQRVYEPYNVIVEEVANNSIATIRGEMEANNANPLSSGIRDGYVIVGKAVTPGGQSVGAGGLLGIAGVDTNFFSGNTFPQVNDRDNTTLVFADTVIGLTTSSNELATLLAFTITHEAGHSFTLFHTAADDLFGFLPPDTGLLVGSEVMIGNYTGVQQNFIPMLSRFPMIAGDFNFNPNLIENSYESLANFARSNIGAKSDPLLSGAGKPNPGPVGPSYVTGSGANDLIRITRTGPDSALVTVVPYRNSQLTNLADIPGTNSISYTYSIPLAGGILIDGGLGDDQFVLGADLATEVTVRGMGGIDKLVIDGKNAGAVTYTPDGTNLTGFDSQSDRRGTIQVGATTVHFQEFELTGRISVENVQSFTFRSPGGSDELELINSGDAIRVRGKINDGLDFVQVSVFNANTVVLDTGTNDDAAGNDDVVILKNIFVAQGLTNIEFRTGGGNDVLQLFQGRLDLPGSGGGISFFGGEGNDRLDVLAGEFILGGDETFLFDGGGGNDTFNIGQAVMSLPRDAALQINGGLGDDTVIITPASLSNFDFDGGDGNDALTILGNLNLPAGAIFQFDGGLGDDTLALGGTVVTHKTSTFNYVGGDGFDAIGSAGTARRTWVIGNGTITLDNRLRFNTLESVRGGAGVDVFILTAASSLTGTLDGGGGADVLNVSALRNVRLSLAPSATTSGLTVTPTIAGLTLPTALNIDHVIAGAGVADSLSGLNSPSHWLLNPGVSRYFTGKYALSFTGVDGMFGGSGDDTLFVDSAPRLVRTIVGGQPRLTPVNAIGPRQVFDGGAGNDKVRVNGSAAADVFGFGFNTITARGRTLSYANSESLEVFGGGGNDVFSLVALNYAAQRIDVYGDGGADTFNVAPSRATALRVFGDTITNVPSAIDTLRVIQQGATIVSGALANARSGRVLFNNSFLPLDFFGMERAVGGTVAAGGGGGGSGGQFRPF